MPLTEQQRAIVLERLEAGESLRKASVQAGLKHEIEVRRLAQRDAEFESQYARARETGYKTIGDELLTVSDDLSIPAEDRRIMVDTRKWMLSKMLPKVYGERLNVEHSGAVQNALTTDELMRIAAQAATPVERMRLEMLDSSVSDADQKPDSNG
jgi:acyl-CoA synthetase (NDP forming)